jgi:hypothetical protein
MTNRQSSHQEIVLFAKLTLPLEQAAERIIQIALPTYIYQLRDGLNIGGGSYIRFTKDDTEIMLVCNDEMHPDVFVPSRKEFLYYCFVYRGSAVLLDAMRSSLISSGIKCEFGERAAKTHNSPGLVKDAAQLTVTEQRHWVDQGLIKSESDPAEALVLIEVPTVALAPKALFDDLASAGSAPKNLLTT